VKAKSRFSTAKGKRRGIEGPPRVAEARATPAIAGNAARPVRAEPIYTPYASVLHSFVVTPWLWFVYPNSRAPPPTQKRRSHSLARALSVRMRLTASARNGTCALTCAAQATEYHAVPHVTLTLNVPTNTMSATQLPSARGLQACKLTSAYTGRQKQWRA
jgi:hypothetical protein